MAAGRRRLTKRRRASPLTVDTHITKQMSIDPAEFMRLLPIALQGFQYTGTPGGIEVSTPDLLAAIRYEPLPLLQIASLKLPRLLVSFEVSAPTADTARRFVEQFLSHYQRGGG
jgi:hypothetical protein